MEVNEACMIIQEAAHEEANIVFGTVIDASLNEEIQVTVIATGFDPNQQQEIIHADPKKIIHSLDGNNEIIQDFNSENEDKKIPLQFDFSSESIDFKNTDLPETDDLEIEQADDFDKIYKGEISKSGAAILPSKRVRRMPEKIAAVKDDEAEENIKKTDKQAEQESALADNKTK